VGRRLERLRAKQVENAKRPGYHADGGGLYLQVSESGSKSWIFRYQLNGREREMGLGSLDAVSLAAARKSAERYRGLLQDRIDPIEARDAQAAQEVVAKAQSIAFRDCAKHYVEAHKAGWKNKKHADQWANTLETYCGPVFGALPVSHVDDSLVLKVLEPIWTKLPETASRLRGRIEKVLDWARVRKYRHGENPARWRGHLDKLLPALKKKARVKHHPALPYDEMGPFMVDLRAEDGTAARSLELLILTATRTNEVTGAKPEEFDLHKSVWTIPAARMKAQHEHRVPLSTPAVEIVRAQLKVLPENAPYLFPGQKDGKPLSNMAMLALLDRMDPKDRKWRDPRSGRRAVPHGFRSSFRDWSAETTNYPRDLCEMALAHTIGDETEAAYRRGDLFDKRRRLMADWAKFCQLSPVKRGTVVKIGIRSSPPTPSRLGG
jgi:integrase